MGEDKTVDWKLVFARTWSGKQFMAIVGDIDEILDRKIFVISIKAKNKIEAEDIADANFGHEMGLWESQENVEFEEIL